VVPQATLASRDWLSTGLSGSSLISPADTVSRLGKTHGFWSFEVAFLKLTLHQHHNHHRHLHHPQSHDASKLQGFSIPQGATTTPASAGSADPASHGGLFFAAKKLSNRSPAMDDFPAIANVG
jgi:hypothetical protein